MDVVLVHGAYHGAWCWKFLTPELEGLGHRVVAVDLPVSDPAQGAAEYADAVLAAIDSSSRPVVVGHSMGGVVIPLVAERRPVQRLVFLAAFLPIPGRSVSDQRKSEPVDGQYALKTAEWTNVGDDIWMVGPHTATELFFPDARADLAGWATRRLRAQAYRVMNEPSPLGAWPKVESDYILCRHDRALNPDWSRLAARERLGVEAIELDGGHSPFLTRPAELAGVLDALIRKDLVS